MSAGYSSTEGIRSSFFGLRLLDEKHTLCKANVVCFQVNVVQLKTKSERLFLGYSFPAWFSDWMKNAKSIFCPPSEEDDDVDGG